MACLRKKAGKKGFVYVIDFSHGGKRYVRSTGVSDYRLAKKFLDDIKGRIASGKFDLKDYDKRHICLSRFFDEYFQAGMSSKKPSTILNERNYARKFINFAGETIDLRAVDNRLLDRWKSWMLSRHSPTTFNIERRSLHAAFNMAIRWGYLDSNPMSEVKKAHYEEKRLYLTDVELQSVFERIDHDIRGARSGRTRNSLARFRTFIQFLLDTGLRREEAIRLQPKDIDLSQGRYGLIHVEQTKTGRTRIVPLTSRAREIILASGEELFSGINKNHASRRFAYYLARTGLEGFKLHSLRHTYASKLVSIGVDIYTVSRLLGHADIRTSMIYAKLSLDALQSAVLKLDNSRPRCKESVIDYVGMKGGVLVGNNLQLIEFRSEV